MIDLPLKCLPDIHGHRPVFQPIVSLKEKRVLGFEALTRCVDSATGCLLPPGNLFEAARKTGLGTALDRISRDHSIRAFSEAGWGKTYPLFLNVDPSILSRMSLENEGFLRTVERMGLAPARVAIEIVESRMASPEDLSALVDRYRGYGFLMVLDDFGAAHANLDRILLLRPDIVKIDRELVHGVADDFYRRSVVGAIVGLAERIGTLTLAEGVETYEDILTCYELGIHLFQGFRFARPTPLDRLSVQTCAETLSDVFEEIHRRLDARVQSRVRTRHAAERTAGNLCGALEGKPAERFDEILRERIPSLSGVQCLYVLGDDGRQFGETMFIDHSPVPSRHPLFASSAPGADHSLKPYFCYPEILGVARFFTDPYMSLATGSVCRTLSVGFEGDGGKPFLLCIDVDADYPGDCAFPPGA